MKRLLIFVLVSSLCLMSFGQSGKKTRNIAQTDANAVSARKISVQYTEGLKAFYNSNMAEALSVFNGIILDNPKHDASYYMLSRIYTEQQNTHDAVESLLKAIKINKKNVWYKVDLADLYFQMQDYPAAAKIWEQVCKEKNNNEYYLYALSEAYLNMKKLEKVVDTYNRMEKIIGYNDDITQAKVSIWLYMNKIKEAVGEYDKLIKMFPHTAEYYVKAGNIYQSNNMPAQAMEYYKRAQELSSNDPQFNITMANYWEQQGNFEKQVQALLKVFGNSSVTMQEKLPYMRTLLGKALRNKDAKAVSLADMLADTLIAVHPDDANGYAFKATSSIVQKKYEQALTNFEQALAIDNATYSLWDDYCFVLNQLDRWPNLLKYENDLQELFPQNARMLCNLGLAHLYSQHADKAIEYFMQAKTFAYEKEQLDVIYQGLAEAYKLKGDNDAADMWRKKMSKK